MWQIIKATAVVQFSRSMLTLYAAFFVWPLLSYHNTIAPSGLLIFTCLLSAAGLGIFYSCVRVQYSRWIISTILIAIPAIVLALMCGMKIFSSPETWLDWLLEPLGWLLWLGLPIVASLSLFYDKSTTAYFMRAKSL
jgi:hypothetical protein